METERYVLMKRVCILNPYLPTLGGGEKMMGCLCKFMEEYYDDVSIDILVHSYNDIDIHDEKYITISDFTEKFALDLNKTQIRKTDVIKSNKYIDRLKNKIHIERITKEYDLFINCEFLSKHTGYAAKNLYLCMFPANRTGRENGGIIKNILSRIFDNRYINGYTVFSPISEYTNHWFTVFWGHKNNSKIIYPPVLSENDIKISYREDKKKNIIISVGRFFVSTHCKRQLEMVEMFVKHREIFKNYEYHLVGAISNAPEDIDYLNKVTKAASAVDNVFIHTNCPYDELVELYLSAKIFWHAAGYTIDENKEPEKVEHFGISTVEAMSYGAVPVVINKGGQKETIVDGVSGFLWNNEEECIANTRKLIENDEKRIQMAKEANKRSNVFSIEAYFRANKELFDEYEL